MTTYIVWLSSPFSGITNFQIEVHKLHDTTQAARVFMAEHGFEREWVIDDITPVVPPSTKAPSEGEE